MSNCKTILIVEDELEIQQALKDALELEGYKVITASNGKEAIDLLEKTDKPALIFLDIMMPIMDGLQFLKLLNGDVTLTPIPVIVTTSSAHLSQVEGTHSFVRKPYDLDLILKIASEICNDS